MSFIDNFNPVQYIYLNPELSNVMSTVEDAYNYYTTNIGNNLGLYSNYILPDGWNYKIYLVKNSNNIASNLSSLYSNLIVSDPERVAIIHNTRYNQSKIYQYSIASDFKQEIYRTFNDVGVTHLMPSEYYVDYITRSNLGLLIGNPYESLGTVSDFMENFLNKAFENGYIINSDLLVNGLTTTKNLTVQETIIGKTLTLTTATLSNLSVDTLTVNNNSFIDTILQDNVKLDSNLTVLGENAIFSNNVQISNLTVLNTSLFNNNVTLNKQLNVFDIATFYSNIEIKSNVQIDSNLLIYGYIQTDGNCILNNQLIVKNISTFNSNVYINNNLQILSNLIVNETTTINNTLTLNSNLNVSKSSVFNDLVILNSNLNVSGISTFSNNVQINSNLIISNNLFVDNSLNVINNSTFSNNVQINSNLIILNNLFVDNSLNVSNSSTFSNDVQINSNLKVLNLGQFNTLQVSGDVAFSNNLIVSNNIIATEFISISDYRIKNNITDLDYNKSRELLKKINIKEYQIFNSKIKNIGIIAQELELITNQLIRNIDNYTIKLYTVCYVNKDMNYYDSICYNMPSTLLSEGDTITYYYNEDYNENNEDNKNIGIVSLIDKKTFTLNNKNNKKEHSYIYIIDRTINNFKSINYSEVTMLCVSCIQDIYNKISDFESKYNSIGHFIV
jgi:UDP-3-O-[3-hydroxymyristoyl] glucosamine N-acyltransferase